MKKFLLQIIEKLDNLTTDVKEMKAEQRELKQILIDSWTEARSEAKQFEMLSSQNEADIKSMQDELEIIKEQLPKT